MAQVLRAFLELLLMAWEFSCALIFRILELIFPPSLVLDGGTSILIKRQVAEGGFSYVFKARDRKNNRPYALKKILCQTEEQLEAARREMSYHKEFDHPSLMPLVDSAVHKDPRGGSKAVVAFLLFPYLPGGSLREEINKRILTPGGIAWSELSILRLFKGILLGVNELHTHNPALAHRDIKPENVLLALDGANPVLMDFGSIGLAEVRVRSRSQALTVQDEASVVCTMPYRAPELFDVKSDTSLDARVDVWSLGCVLFAMAFGYSPFECEFSEAGKPRVVECTYLRVISKVPYPPSHKYSPEFVDMIDWILQQDHTLRPFVTDIMRRVDELMERQAKHGPTTLEPAPPVVIDMPTPATTAPQV